MSRNRSGEKHWGDELWEVTRGCSAMSTSCLNCPSQTLVGFSAERNKDESLVRHTVNGYKWTGRIRLLPDKLTDPLYFPSQSRVVVNPNSDLFHEHIPNSYLMDVFDVMATTDHTYMISTKRPHHMLEWFESDEGQSIASMLMSRGYEWPLPNVWIGVSVENQSAADHRIPPLLEAPIACRFLVCQPLIGQVVTSEIACPKAMARMEGADPAEDFTHCGMCQAPIGDVCDGRYFDCLEEGIDWVIAGCEDGFPSERRHMDLNWVRSLREECALHQVPFYYRQAVNDFGEVVWLPFLDGRTHCESPYDGRR